MQQRDMLYDMICYNMICYTYTIRYDTYIVSILKLIATIYSLAMKISLFKL